MRMFRSGLVASTNIFMFEVPMIGTPPHFFKELEFSLAIAIVAPFFIFQVSDRICFFWRWQYHFGYEFRAVGVLADRTRPLGPGQTVDREFQ